MQKKKQLFIENKIIKDILDEYLFATNKYSAFNSANEGYAVIKEEVDELWDIIKKKQSERNYNNLRKEAIQIAAMAIRFIVDIYIKENKS